MITKCYLSKYPRNLFTEILPLTGTNPAALMVKELVLSGKLSDVEAQRMVAFIPYYLRLPSEKLLASWEDLLKGSSSIKTKYMKYFNQFIIFPVFM